MGDSDRYNFIALWNRNLETLNGLTDPTWSSLGPPLTQIIFNSVKSQPPEGAIK